MGMIEHAGGSCPYLGLSAEKTSRCSEPSVPYAFDYCFRERSILGQVGGSIGKISDSAFQPLGRNSSEIWGTKPNARCSIAEARLIKKVLAPKGINPILNANPERI